MNSYVSDKYNINIERERNYWVKYVLDKWIKNGYFLIILPKLKTGLLLFLTVFIAFMILILQGMQLNFAIGGPSNIMWGSLEIFLCLKSYF